MLCFLTLQLVHLQVGSWWSLARGYCYTIYYVDVLFTHRIYRFLIFMQSSLGYLKALKTIKSKITSIFTNFSNTVAYIDKKSLVRSNSISQQHILMRISHVISLLFKCISLPNKREIIHSLIWWGLGFLRCLNPFCFLQFMSLAGFFVCC